MADTCPSRQFRFLYDYRWQRIVALGCLHSLVMQRFPAAASAGGHISRCNCLFSAGRPMLLPTLL
jgi:hypothetical protein